MSLWFFLAVVIVATGPIGRALAQRLSGRVPDGPGGADLDALERRVEDRIADLEDRLEFVERLIEKQRARDGLPPID